MTEDNIKHETENFYIIQDTDGFEIRCHNSSKTYSVAVGRKAELEGAITTVDRLEPNVEKYRQFAGIN